MSSLKDLERKPGTSTDLGKSKEGRGLNLEKPTKRPVGRRSLFVKAGVGSQAAGQGMKVRALVKRIGW